MPSIGPMELVVVLVIALLILGPKRLPEAGRSLGSSIRGFKQSLRETNDDLSVEQKTGTAEPEPAEHATRV